MKFLHKWREKEERKDRKKIKRTRDKQSQMLDALNARALLSSGDIIDAKIDPRIFCSKNHLYIGKIERNIGSQNEDLLRIQRGVSNQLQKCIIKNFYFAPPAS